MIQFLRSLFSSRSPVNLSNAIEIETIENDSERERRPTEREPTQRETPSRSVRKFTIQPVTITIVNGEVKITPTVRDLYENEEVKWICKEQNWEVRFDQTGSPSPFVNKTFGPGLEPQPESVVPENSDFPDIVDEDSSGGVQTGAFEGDYVYSAQVGGFGPVSARIKIIRKPRI